jgi:long-chain acyl-CoA synthetase
MVAEDGEILAKGPNVMAGYWNNPGATHEMFDDQGWLCTGDIGKFDSAGYLTITDRKKDIIVLANGKNVAPQPIEGLFKQSRFISEVVLFGDKSGTISALVIPNLPSFNDLSPTTSKTADQAYEEEHLAAMKKTIKVEMDRLSVRSLVVASVDRKWRTNSDNEGSSGQSVRTARQPSRQMNYRRSKLLRIKIPD